jgi:predicted MPP superfamily phosphohydrolase
MNLNNLSDKIIILSDLHMGAIGRYSNDLIKFLRNILNNL